MQILKSWTGILSIMVCWVFNDYVKSQNSLKGPEFQFLICEMELLYGFFWGSEDLADAMVHCPYLLPFPQDGSTYEFPQVLRV